MDERKKRERLIPTCTYTVCMHVVRASVANNRMKDTESEEEEVGFLFRDRKDWIFI